MSKQMMSWSSAAVVVVAMMLSATAQAAAWRTCNGTPVTWESGHFGTTRVSCSIPSSGDVSSAYWNAVGQWQSISPVINSTTVWPVEHCYSTHGDGYNDVMLAARADIDGNNGLTILQLDGCTWWFSTENIIEADAMVASDMTFYNPDESQWADSVSGRMTMVHELGHSHGLQHYDSLGVMKTLAPRAYAGGTGDHAAVLPDDDYGIRTLYGANSYRNLFASAQGVNGILSSPVTVNVCRNQSLSVGFTFGNMGSIDANNFRIRLSMANVPPPSGFTGGYTLGYWTGWASADGWYTSYYGFTVPYVPTGIYWLYFRVDDNNQFSETREYDNVTHSPMTLNVMNCTY